MLPAAPRQTLRPVPVVLAALLASLTAGAAPAPPEPRSETVPSIPGSLLPLRSGELAVPTADGTCSVVVFAPHQERFDRLTAYWKQANWTGACRFGLAHGEGAIAAADGSWSQDTVMLYGTEVNPAEITKTQTAQDGAKLWTSISGTLNFFSGPAFNDVKSKRYTIRLDREPSRDLELGDMVSDWYGTDYLERRTFDEDGREQVMSVSAWAVTTYCGLGLPDEFKSYPNEVKKACKKTGDKLVLLRREGAASDLWVDRPITWLKSCPISKSSKANDCGALVRSALSKEAAELEAFLTDGDIAARSAAEQEIIDRYKPFEDAYAASLLIKVRD